MTATLETMDRFIELRAEGWSYAKISAEIGVSKKTLIDWDKKWKNEIDNLRIAHCEELLEKHKLSKEHRIEGFAKRLKSIDDEIERRDFSDVPTIKLIELRLRIQSAIDEEIPKLEITTKEELIKEAFDWQDRYGKLSEIAGKVYDD